MCKKMTEMLIKRTVKAHKAFIIYYSLTFLIISGCSNREEFTRLKPLTWGNQNTLLSVQKMEGLSLAEAAGIQKGDLLTRLDNHDVQSADKFDTLLNNGKGVVSLQLIREGIPWDLELPESVRKQGLGWTLIPSYQSFPDLDPPTLVVEGESQTITSWINLSPELTVVSMKLENRSTDRVEITPPAFTLLNGERTLVKPYYARDLAQSYLDSASTALDRAQLGVSGNRLAVSLGSGGPIELILATLFMAIPAHVVSKNTKAAQHSQQMAANIIDRAFPYGEVPGQSTVEGLLYYPPVDSFPVTVLVKMENKTWTFGFTNEVLEARP
jgi:hypothetical protein